VPLLEPLELPLLEPLELPLLEPLLEPLELPLLEPLPLEESWVPPSSARPLELLLQATRSAAPTTTARLAPPTNQTNRAIVMTL
jgi:hypothetical protein